MSMVMVSPAKRMWLTAPQVRCLYHRGRLQQKEQQRKRCSCQQIQGVTPTTWEKYKSKSKMFALIISMIFQILLKQFTIPSNNNNNSNNNKLIVIKERERAPALFSQKLVYTVPGFLRLAFFVFEEGILVFGFAAFHVGVNFVSNFPIVSPRR